MEAGLSTSLWMTDRWVGLAHAPQMYCFSPVLCVLSVFKIINGTPRNLGGYFLGFLSKYASAGCSGLGNNDTHLYIISVGLEVISCIFI